MTINTSAVLTTQCRKFRFLFHSGSVKFSIIVRLKRKPSFIEHDRESGKVKNLGDEKQKFLFSRRLPGQWMENEKSLAQLEKYPVFEAVPAEAEI